MRNKAIKENVAMTILEFLILLAVAGVCGMLIIHLAF